MNGLKSRATAITIGVSLIGLFLLYAFWPRPAIVDIGAASHRAMVITVDEEAKTRVRDAYVVSAPISGRLLRIDVDPGDDVIGHQSVIARMLPTNPAVLDVRTENQARAAIEAAEAALTLAKAEVKRASADADYAKVEEERARTLRDQETIAQASLDKAHRARRISTAAVDTARAAVAMRQADLENARLMLMSFDDAQKLAIATNPHPKESIPLTAPISGSILRLIQESEAIIPAGAPILEIGDPSGDLEIVAELLSTDAVNVSPGDTVLIENWGGGASLRGVVERVEPWGFTKFSALGVEEQRVNVIINFAGDAASHARLGHGFRVEVKIVIWENSNALTAPASAVFRSGDDWAVFKAAKGRARTQIVQIGRNNGIEAEIIEGLEEGDAIILYPGADISDGARIAKRMLE